MLPTIYFDAIQVVFATVAITVAPPTAAVAPGDSLQFEAAASGVPNAAVTWSVLGGDADGTVTPDGSYTAPATPGRYHVVATSAADASWKGVSEVTVGVPNPPDVAVSVNPSSASLTTGGTRSFAAAVTGSTHRRDLVGPGGAAGGTITARASTPRPRAQRLSRGGPQPGRRRRPPRRRSP